MKRSVAAVVAVFLLSASVLAGGPVLVVSDSGYSLMTQGADGKPVVTPIEKVVDLRNGDTPEPPKPPDPPSDSVASQVEKWTRELNDPTTAAGMAMIYEKVGEAAAGQSREDVLQALREASDAWLIARGAANKWGPSSKRGTWRWNLSELIDREEAKGPVNWPKFCKSVADGLKASSPDTAIPPELLAILLQIIQLLISRFFGGSGV